MSSLFSNKCFKAHLSIMWNFQEKDLREKAKEKREAGRGRRKERSGARGQRIENKKEDVE